MKHIFKFVNTDAQNIGNFAYMHVSLINFWTTRNTFIHPVYSINIQISHQLNETFRVKHFWKWKVLTIFSNNFLLFILNTIILWKVLEKTPVKKHCVRHSIIQNMVDFTHYTIYQISGKNYTSSRLHSCQLFRFFVSQKFNTNFCLFPSTDNR